MKGGERSAPQEVCGAPLLTHFMSRLTREKRGGGRETDSGGGATLEKNGASAQDCVGVENPTDRATRGGTGGPCVCCWCLVVLPIVDFLIAAVVVVLEMAAGVVVSSVVFISAVVDSVVVVDVVVVVFVMVAVAMVVVAAVS